MNLNETSELSKTIDELDQIILAGGRPSSDARIDYLGTLTRDPNLRYLPNGTAVCEFGVKFQESQWDPHPYILLRGIVYERNLCIAYGKTAKIIHNFHRKGSEINIRGFFLDTEEIHEHPDFIYEKSLILVNEVNLSEIQQFCYERNIKTLCHFTRVERLRSILHRALLSREFLEKLPESVRPPFTDQDRDDGFKDAICVSISFPNYKMFFSKTGRDNQHEWVVLLLDVRILWELDCAFCHQNAIYEPVHSVPLEYRKRYISLDRMFGETDYHSDGTTYQRQHIPDNFTTHPEAEVLVFDTIPAEYINEIHFYNDNALRTWRTDNSKTYSQKICSNQNYFKPRCDYKAWQN